MSLACKHQTETVISWYWNSYLLELSKTTTLPHQRNLIAWLECEIAICKSESKRGQIPGKQNGKLTVFFFSFVYICFLPGVYLHGTLRWGWYRSPDSYLSNQWIGAKDADSRRRGCGLWEVISSYISTIHGRMVKELCLVGCGLTGCASMHRVFP